MRLAFRVGGREIRPRAGLLNGEIQISDREFSRLRRALRGSRKRELKIVMIDANGREANFTDGIEHFSLSGKIRSVAKTSRAILRSPELFQSFLTSATTTLRDRPSLKPGQLIPATAPPVPTPPSDDDSAGSESSPTFALRVDSATSEITFEGTATGRITLTGPAGSISTFSREGVAQTVSISPLNTYTITLSSDSNNLDASAYTSGIRVTGSTTSDLIQGSPHSDVLAGGAGDDVITGGDGADSLAGGPGNNVFRFNTGDVDTGETVTLSGTTDSFEVITTTEFNLMNTGGSITGLDAIRISAGQSAVFLSNQLTGLTFTVDGVAGGVSETLVVNASTNSGATINLSGATLTNAIGSITGGNGGDTITGTNADDIITTGPGTDIINAGGGNNQITGAGWTSGGYEQITHNTAGATVTISVTGSNGVRLIASELGASVIAADGGLRSIFADFSTASVTLNASALSQSSYNAVLEGGSANDTITGGAGADVITGGGGADNITAGAGVDRLIHKAVVEVSSDSNAATTDTVADLAATDFVILNLTNVNNFEVASDVMGHNTTAGEYTADTNGNATYTDIGDVVFNTTSFVTDTQARALTILMETTPLAVERMQTLLLVVRVQIS